MSFREQAFLVCQDPKGKLVHGPVVDGKRDGVPSFFARASCPVKTKAVGVMHTHPPDSSIEASNQDIQATQIAGLAFVCVGFRGRVKCYPVPQKAS